MAAEYIYEYWKTKPSYVPSAFSISGSAYDTVAVAKFGGALGAIYGEETPISDALLSEINADDSETVLVIGASEAPKLNKSASTAEEELKILFANAKPSNVRIPRRRKEGGNDEILDTCPGSDDEEIEIEGGDDEPMTDDITRFII